MGSSWREQATGVGFGGSADSGPALRSLPATVSAPHLHYHRQNCSTLTSCQDGLRQSETVTQMKPPLPHIVSVRVSLVTVTPKFVNEKSLYMLSRSSHGSLF